MSTPLDRPWELPCVVAAVAEAPPLPFEATELCRRVFEPVTDELYRRAAKQAADQPSQAA